ncbi:MULTISPECIES: pyridoxal 5'-phosphate synthase glutaminase subunit PdxT [Caproicibacterium]|mgnify:CR=1 FL=1|jgi:5'-phosphate synthase pdxT subunit|uniref:Pyridoxal 5'-phosphate synthase subunit PdxT n=1 Tax=Caproicibacterium lactatifermentans TaxID=2666138 RepID=A0A859DRL3_9FIRM|nr:pyridoxal 5'-phosphate synthase glutaminase subunit PdxT [Caproicibacterium lactatifermentans]ARP50137.1 pyridoxal 5'-phosphate synthase glutaminase subunit PdxT [Ruminococcaceae bacterium CPB6]MDD4807574.1 pyridoxal 5'-phosphate synthase glutaminase subunit PdxT [Oscillospiraceae bacterium]QKN24139.1 pyridoxal 5'-phosphate synthase glutaminase subunit PdxT [Caproicibacterium lactatifermentans]QKO30793.1 pyridoxal 5'-phosphate synthase glutaminase subunit PdxT [Caproicibacterium lactatiferme
MKIGVFALQGAFAEHSAMLHRLGVESREIRQRADMNDSFDGFILPGGESTVMRKLLLELGLQQPLSEQLDHGVPIFGTCAGLLLLAKQVENGPTCLSRMDIAAKRNAYGRQLGSFTTVAPFAGIDSIPMTFIRAPYISRTFGAAQPLAEVNGKIVAAQQGNMLVTAFHPELTADTRVHAYFLDMVRRAAQKAS